MAKNNYLFGFFICLVAGLCIGIGGVVVGVRYWALGDRATGINSFEQSTIIQPKLDLRSLRWPSVLGTSSVLLDGNSDWEKKWLTRRLGDEVNENVVSNQIKEIYTAEIGVREKTGKNDGERVEEYLAVTQLGAGYAWCAAFVSWVFSEAGFPEPRTPWSPALFPKKRVIWERGKSLKPNTQNLMPRKPKPADIFGIYFANLKRIAHVGFVDEWGEKQIITVEGNTNEAGSGEGDGVYRKRRPIISVYQVANWIDQEVEL